MTAGAWWFGGCGGGRAGYFGLIRRRCSRAALERLSTCETPPIPYRDLIPGIARQLTLMRRNDGRPSPSLAAQLKPVVSHLQSLAQGERWDGLAQDERASPPASYNLPLPLRRRLIALAAEAGEIAPEIEAFLSHASRQPRARPQHTAAPRIAVYLYQEFERLTGRTPSRSVVNGEERGEFTVLVREIFEILGVKASPERAARYAIEGQKLHGGKSRKIPI
jgi:hypothetical protein